MDWITGIQRALDYIEAHLTEEIDGSAVARLACSSPFHFQRMFHMLCGYPLGEYIRLRRLTAAANDLLQTEDKVIDIALKYGYDTPESFSRAFARFHGISPTEARRGGTVRSFSRLSVKLILLGGNTMDYRIEKTGPIPIVCKRKEVAQPMGETASEDISAFWRDCTADGTIDRLEGYLPNAPALEGILGICFSGDQSEETFPYGIGAEYNGAPLSGDGLEVMELPAGAYAVFPCKGGMPEAYEKTYRQICTEFFPQSGYEYGGCVEIEVYPDGDPRDPNYTCEIWVAVKEKP